MAANKTVRNRKSMPRYIAGIDDPIKRGDGEILIRGDAENQRRSSRDVRRGHSGLQLLPLSLRNRT
jgi:hypothetical protein